MTIQPAMICLHDYLTQTFWPSIFLTSDLLPQKLTNCSTKPQNHLFVPQNLGQIDQSEQLDPEQVLPAWTCDI
jgi:hypothetical protein